MSLDEVLNGLRMNRDFMSQVEAWERMPARSAEVAPFSPRIAPELISALQQRGIHRLYVHQTAAIEAVWRGENVVVSTATASGKSLCYTIPILNHLLNFPGGFNHSDLVNERGSIHVIIYWNLFYIII